MPNFNLESGLQDLYRYPEWNLDQRIIQMLVK